MDTDDWGPSAENPFEHYLIEETINNGKDTVSDEDRWEALRRMMAEDGVEEVIGLEEISEMDFTIEVVK